ncbi:MAG: UTP--glucose-1-phosphate uridylyltransferase [Methylococcales symbiont of Hymedesmia sp. n. MRB-2018]|nr:MAG: UTP--glucose-1-phosphate uridylyltransferase [Methylococcales symbiont of Hymedesmia sp. n. MRB-2018]
MNREIKNNIRQIMTTECLPQLCIDVFLSQYNKMIAGEESVIRDTAIEAVENVVDMDSLADCSQQGKAVLNQTVILKLNGGLGTDMGLEKAKSLLLAKEGLSFLEIIVKQLISQRHNFNCDLPLIFMNSFATEKGTQKILRQFPELIQGQKNIPFSFIQNKVPKILVDSKEPALWPQDPAKTWCPPGHGDIYTALQTSGLLDQLLNQGIKYAFISNSDNLGANLDLSLLGYFAEQDSSFMMEVTDRTEADKKGGHLARTVKGGLLLRESAQCHSNDINGFQDINKYKYFNTNNLWIRLDRLKQLLDENNGIIDLPFIQNIKNLDPGDAFSPKVIQMETAMGAAISKFKDSIALRVPKSRFIPIKTSNELLGLWSNAFVLDDNNLIVTNPHRKNDYLIIKLDNKYFKKIDDLQARFAEGVPDLLECQQLTIMGDVKFGSNVKIIGNVTLCNDSDEQLVIASDTVIAT